MEARRRHPGRVKTLKQPMNNGGCSGLRSIFSGPKHEKRSDSIVVDQNAMQQGRRYWKCLQAAVWKLRHSSASVAWSIPAYLLKIHVFLNEGSQKPHHHGIGYKTKREGSQYMSSPIIKHFFVSLFAVVHAAEYAPNPAAQIARSFHSEGSSSRAMRHGDVSFGKVVIQRFMVQRDQRKQQGTRTDRSTRLLGTLGRRPMGRHGPGRSRRSPG